MADSGNETGSFLSADKMESGLWASIFMAGISLVVFCVRTIVTRKRNECRLKCCDHEIFDISTYGSETSPVAKVARSNSLFALRTPKVLHMRRTESQRATNVAAESKEDSIESAIADGNACINV